jgi:TolB-like protein/Tfp pilus assembly protein PilF
MGESAIVGTSLNEFQRTEVRRLLDQLLTSPEFSSSLRRGQLLRYLVERAMDTDSPELNEYAIALDVFEKPPSFDPRLESIVRTEVGRLRQRLREYFAGSSDDPEVLIHIPLRSYKPEFVFRQRVPAPPARTSRWRPALLTRTLVVLLAVAALVLEKPSNSPEPPIRSLGIVPFTSLSGQSTDTLSEGLADELTGLAADWGEFQTVARTPSFRSGVDDAELGRIGRDMKVDGILRGAVSRRGELTHITAQLHRVSDGSVVWSESYNARSEDPLIVQHEIAQAIATSLRQFRGVRRAVRHSPANNPEAIDLYIRASYEYARLTPDSLERSMRLFRAAIAKDSSYARAYVGLATAQMELTNFHSSGALMDQARDALYRAIKLDPDLGDAHGMLANVAARDNDWPRATREFRLALEDGAKPNIYAAYGWCLAGQCRFSEAQKQCAAAENLEPLGIAPRFCQFYIYYGQRRYALARKMILETLDINPNLIYAHATLGLVALAQNDCPEAVRQFDWAAHRMPPAEAAILLAYGSACSGDTARARRYLTQAADPHETAKYYELARGYAYLHDADNTLAFVRKSLDAGEGAFFFIQEPGFDWLRSDPRFVALAGHPCKPT